MKQRTWHRWGILLLVALTLAGCGRLGRRTSPATTPTVIRSNDGRSQVRIPAGWSSLDLGNEEANLQAGDRKQQAFAIVLTEAKTDFAAGVTYREHAEMTLKNLRKNLQQSQVIQGPTELTVQGRRAVQYEVVGTLLENRTRIHYLHITVDGKSSYHQVLAWTVPSRMAENRPTLEAVIQSFTELP